MTSPFIQRLLDAPNDATVRRLLSALGIGSTTDAIPEGTGNLYYTDERARDALAATLVQGSNITITVDDVNNTITISSTGSAGPPAGFGGWADMVSTFGADPTGVADSLAAFNAFKASSTHQVAWLPPGTYRLSAVLTWDVDKALIGPGSTHATLKSYGSGYGVVIRPPSSGAKIELKGFTIDGSSNTQSGVTMAGVLVQRKVYATDVVVKNFNGSGARYAPYDASVVDGTGGTIGNASFFGRWIDCWFTDNGIDGMDVRMGANDTGFINCQFIRNGIATGAGVGFHHRTDGGATYGNWLIGGQWSYNCGYGGHFESGTDFSFWALYGEYNGSTDNTNTNGYVNTLIDTFVGDNSTRADGQIGVLFNGSTTHVRAPSSGLNDSCTVRAGGDRVFGSTRYHTPHEVPGPAAPSFATLADAQTWCAAARTANLSGGTWS